MAPIAPERSELIDRGGVLGPRVRHRRKDVPAALKKRGEARVGARILGAGNGVGRDHRVVRQRFGERLGDRLLAGADIADQRLGRQRVGHFRRRFAHIERELEAGGETLDNATLERMEELWQAAKAIERQLG